MHYSNSSNPTSSASSASGETSLSGEYEVFLSFCGKDTRKGFTDFLYADLHGAGVVTFRDDNELRVGEEIGAELIKAIKNSKISIPIFSKNYASSKWCLLELAHIVKCYTQAKKEKMIFPIFYDVEPCDVRHQSGSYEEAFQQHEKKMPLEVQKLQSWREALTEVGQLKGLELKKETGGREGELVKLIVKKSLQFLKKNYQHVPKNMVGMENHIRNLTGLLDDDYNEVRIVGIYGMGGLGKTTMAMIIYNKLCEHFEGHCFLENVREKSNPHDRIVNLQNQLISKIQNREVPNFNDFNEGSNMIKEAVRGRKLLIVLDDADEKFHVDMLIGSENWFGVQSRIIITTRNKSVLDAIERASKREDILYGYASYKPDIMDDLHALQLFSKYAFTRDFPPQEYKVLSEEVVSIAAGLPLALVVFGSTFSEVEGKDIWEDNVKMLRDTPDDKVLAKLRFSFEALKYAQKQIFLDIACHFIGKEVDIPSYMWDDCKFYPREGIYTLIKRSLITTSDGIFKMHDLLRDLGRQIIFEEGLNELGKRSRFWCEEDAMEMLDTSQDANSVNSICIPFNGVCHIPIHHTRDRPCYIPLQVSHFPTLPNLRYLSLKDYDLNGHFKHPLSNLRWLKWTCSGKFTPSNLLMNNLTSSHSRENKLVILDLSDSDFTDAWEGWSHLKLGRKLKLLDLSYCSSITVLPDMSTFASLEMLKLYACRQLCSLDGVQQLKSLKCLDASHCENLEALPRLSNLTNILKLSLSYCSKITEITGLENLISLQGLGASRCYSLQSLNCSNLVNLMSLTIDGCRLLKASPNFSNSKNLVSFNASYCEKINAILGLEESKCMESLIINGCESIKILPNLSKLGNLKTLLASDCVKLTAIPGLGELKSLEQLNIVGCELMEILPNLSKLHNLRSFHASACVKLTAVSGLEELNSLQELDISGCKSIAILPNLSKLENLKILCAIGCVNLTVMPGLGELKSLERLSIARCESISILPDLSKLKNLKELDATDCVKLTAILGLEEMKSLEYLYLDRCDSMETLPNLSKLENLEELYASGCSKLNLISEFGELKFLEQLTISECESISILPNLSKLEHLKYLDAFGCLKLTAIPGLGELKSLNFLNVSGCNSLEILPNLAKLENLIELDASDCVKLTCISGLGELKFLKRISIEGCNLVEILPDLSKLESIQGLNAFGCAKLVAIPGLGELKSLEWLTITGCESIHMLPNLSNLENLERLYASGCGKLTAISGIEGLTSLQELYIAGCEGLETLPDLPNTRIFR